MTQVRFCRTFLVSEGFNTRECESEGRVRGERRANDRDVINEKLAESVCQSGNRRMIRKVYFRATV